MALVVVPFAGRAVASATTAVAEVVIQPDGLVQARLIPGVIAGSSHPVIGAEWCRSALSGARSPVAS